MNDEIKVDFGALSTAAGDISGQASQVQQQLDELKSRIDPVIAQWQGASSDAYAQAQAKWNESASGLQQVLAAIGTAVASANDAYNAAERKNEGRWG
ncbi:WXG100 family type VII secretion target [Saccharothrix yanglingensis]|uniref:ESAT-6-like protein n=1 Tax=Saccharothrix yanglingensis TaxID=659496 RepID=A0ABU0WRP4_9PSEU|nr:WXG100 family type VII secretion target [Saccharothrix yanglingensis]MDQ2582511.1 WXG100 family type VII secretion target [Saccharothrix yanglingensis]